MSENLMIALVGFCCTTIGYFLRSFLDLFISAKQEKARIAIATRVERLSQQLSNFYWPIYFRLQKDNAVYQLMFEKKKADAQTPTKMLSQRIGIEIDKNFILPNHNEVIEIIENNVHLAGIDKELEDQILRYVRHVAVYNALRTSGSMEATPDEFGEVWPSKLFQLIEEQTHRLQREYEKLISSVR